MIVPGRQVAARVHAADAALVLAVVARPDPDRAATLNRVPSLVIVPSPVTSPARAHVPSSLARMRATQSRDRAAAPGAKMTRGAEAAQVSSH